MRLTALPPAPAGFENIIVQVVELLDVRLVAAHCSEEIEKAPDSSDRVAGWVDPLREAVIVAD